MTIQVKENQNIWDVCLQIYGNYNQIISFLNLNNLNMESVLTYGQILTYPDGIVIGSNPYTTNEGLYN